MRAAILLGISLFVVSGQHLDVWPVFGTTRIMPSSAPPKTGSLDLRLQMAKNEAESFQVAFRPKTDLGFSGAPVPVTVSVSLPPVLQATWKQVAFVYVESIIANPQGSGQSWWPDPLVPRVDNVARLATNVTSALWFDVRSAPTTPAGNYSLSVNLSWPKNASSSGMATQSIAVSVQVFNFALPKTFTLKTAIDLSQPRLNASYRFPPDENKTLHDTWMQYARFLLQEYRVNPGTIYAEPALISPQEAQELVSMGMNHFTIASVPRSLPEAELQADALAQHVSELKSLNLESMASVYGFDEADEAPTAVFGYYKSRFANVSTITTAHMQRSGKPEQNASKIQEWHVDHMCPILDWIVPENMTKCVTSGLQMWFYTSCEPYHPYPNIRFDNPLLDARLLFWYAAGLSLDGYLYWGFNAWDTSVATFTPIDVSDTGLSTVFLDPRNWSATTCHRCGLENLQGDGKLLYAGRNGPIGSIRLAAIRDGLEDHEYLAMLAKVKGKSSVQDAIAGVVDIEDVKTHTESTDLLQMRRWKVAQELEAANSKKGNDNSIDLPAQPCAMNWI